MKQYKYTKYITIGGHRFAIRADTKTELGRKIERKIQQEKEKRFSASDRTLSDWAEECIELYKTGWPDVRKKRKLQPPGRPLRRRRAKVLRSNSSMTM